MSSRQKATSTVSHQNQRCSTLPTTSTQYRKPLRWRTHQRPRRFHPAKTGKRRPRGNSDSHLADATPGMAEHRRVSSHARSKIRTAVRDLQARPEGVLARELLSAN